MHFPSFFLSSVFIAVPGILSALRLLSDNRPKTVSFNTNCQVEHTCPITNKARVAEQLRALRDTIQTQSLRPVASC